MQCSDNQNIPWSFGWLRIYPPHYSDHVITAWAILDSWMLPKSSRNSHSLPHISSQRRDLKGEKRRLQTLQTRGLAWNVAVMFIQNVPSIYPFFYFWTPPSCQWLPLVWGTSTTGTTGSCQIFLAVALQSSFPRSQEHPAIQCGCPLSPESFGPKNDTGFTEKVEDTNSHPVMTIDLAWKYATTLPCLEDLWTFSTYLECLLKTGQFAQLSTDHKTCSIGTSSSRYQGSWRGCGATFLRRGGRHNFKKTFFQITNSWYGIHISKKKHESKLPVFLPFNPLSIFQ